MQVWYEEQSTVNDHRVWDRILDAVPEHALLRFDIGFLAYERFDTLCDRERGFVTRPQASTHLHVEQVVRLSGPKTRMRHCLRLVDLVYQGRHYRYLTNVLDSDVLSAEAVVALYWQRWRIEDAFNAAKRLLGLAYLHTGSNNGVQVHV